MGGGKKGAILAGDIGGTNTRLAIVEVVEGHFNFLAEVDTALAAKANQWRTAARVKVLVIVEDFKGRERGADWGDMTFFATHGDQIDKIAIVSEPKWESEILAFAGAGFRRAPVKFFPMNQLTLARACLG